MFDYEHGYDPYEEGINDAVWRVAFETGYNLAPATWKSEKYRTWVARISKATCLICADKSGTVYIAGQTIYPKPPVHEKCRCSLEPVITIQAGTATIEYDAGADYYLKYHGGLPDYYISMEDAVLEGWERGKTPSYFVPGKSIFGGVFDNDNNKLPDAPGRVWYEADINYVQGRRGSHRIVFSNDGLIFVSYDHGYTFYEISAGGVFNARIYD